VKDRFRGNITFMVVHLLTGHHEHQKETGYCTVRVISRFCATDLITPNQSRRIFAVYDESSKGDLF